VDADIVPEGGLDGGTRRWDVEIILEFTCVGGALAITAVDVDVDSRRWLDWLSLGLTRVLSGIAERTGTRSFGSPVFVPLAVCVTPRFNHDGDLTFPGTGGVTCCSGPCS
jgi:hypothetical protein